MSQAPDGVPVCYRHPGRETHIACQRCERPICPECMIPAAVGFQCPECVREANKGVRQARNIRLGGSAVVTWTLIGINAAVFLLVHASSSTLLLDLMQHTNSFCLRSVQGIGCTEISRGVRDGAYWELLTAIFTHQQLLHIGSNMLSLWMIGPYVEVALGRVRYVATYLLCGLGGSALVFWSASPNVPTLGASGAIFGLLGVLIVLFLRRGLPVQQLLIVAALNFYLTFAYSGISWQAHVGGFVTGLVVGGIIALTPGIRRRAQQWAGLGAVAAAIALAIVTRSLTF